MLRNPTQRQVRADWLPRAIIAGFVAGAVMMFAFALAYSVVSLVARGLQNASGPLAFIGTWLVNLSDNSVTSVAGSNLYVIAGLHFLVAIGWALFYGRYAEPRLGGAGWERGVRFAMLPWLVSILVILPLAGGGLLGLALGAGPLPVLGNLLLHLMYGAVVGAVYGPLGDIPADTFSARGAIDDAETTRRSDTRTAEGIVGGLLIGLIGSIVAVLAMPETSPGLGPPQTAIVLTWTLLGGAFGALVGSFAGLTSGR